MYAGTVFFAPAPEGANIGGGQKSVYEFRVDFFRDSFLGGGKIAHGRKDLA
jgi:hypothetical protein